AKDDPPEFEKMLGCLVEGNRPWAKQAPVLLISVAKLVFERTGHPNRHAFHDVGLAMGNLTLQALSVGLFVHQMAGIDVGKVRVTYEIPDGFEAVAGCTIGYAGDAATLPEKYKDRE